MIENPVTHSLEPFDFDHLIDNVPKLKMLHYDIEHYSIDPPIDSSNMSPEHWKTMARVIEDNYHDFDGFVVLHGTDTMAYTASALSFMLQNLSKPVIITGSQLPIGEVRTDGEENLITAIQIAAERDGQQPMVQEVAILFENYLWRGNRATKMSADNFNAFKTNNYPALAKIGLGIHFNHDALLRPDNAGKKLKVNYAFDTNVMFLTLIPGMHRDTLHYFLNTPGIRGIVLKSYGAGNAPSAEWFVDEVRQAVVRGVVVVNVSQCVNGGINARRYATGAGLAAAGVTSGHDLTSEAALTKLMHLLGRRLDLSRVRELMEANLRGEITVEQPINHHEDEDA